MAKRSKREVEYFKIRGKVIEIGDEREVENRWGKESTVTDVTLKTEKGNKVRISFWNEEPSFEEGDKVLITYITSSGSYKGTKQYSTSKKTEVEVLDNDGERNDSGKDDDDNDDAEPADEVEEPEEEDEEEEEEKPRKKRSKKSSKSTEDQETALDKAAKYVTEVAECTNKIVENTIPDKIAENPQACQAYFATIFIALKDQRYFMSKK